MRFSGKLALKVGAVGVAAGAILAPVTAAHAATPTLTVTPNTGVKSGDSVSVTGTGFAASSTVTLAECGGTTTPAATDCDPTTVKTATTDASGAFTATMVTVHTGTVGDKTCAAGATCEISGSTNALAPDATNSAFATFTFAAAVTGPSITVTPATGVKSGDKVSVSGSGFPTTATSVNLVECGSATPAQADCDTSTFVNAPVTNGSFTGAMVTVHTGAVGDKTCTAGGTCYIAGSTVTTGGDATNSAVGSFTFAAATGPTITVTPATGVKSGDKVSVSGSGFPTTATSVNLVECGSATPAQADCDTTTFVNAPVTNGAFTGAMVTVHTGAVGDKTCAAGAACYIAGSTVTTGADATNSAVGTFKFASTTPSGAAITISPTTKVKSGSDITVTGTGFAPKASFYAVECSGTGGQADCDTSALGTGTTDASGNVSGVKVPVHTGKVGDGTCNPGKTCYIAATTDPSGQDTSQQAAATFTFASGSTPPPSHSATKTKAAFSSSKDAIIGAVTSHGTGVKGAHVKLELKKGSHWKTVASTKTHKGGAFSFKHIASGKYKIKAAAHGKFKGSTSKTIKAKA
jgi:hypothetical protein